VYCTMTLPYNSLLLQAFIYGGPSVPLSKINLSHNYGSVSRRILRIMKVIIRHSKSLLWLTQSQWWHTMSLLRH